MSNQSIPPGFAMQNAVPRKTISTHSPWTGSKRQQQKQNHNNNILNPIDYEQTKVEIKELRNMLSSTMVLEDLTKDDAKDNVEPRRNHHVSRGRSRTRSGNSTSSKRGQTSIEAIVQRAKDRRSQLLEESAMITPNQRASRHVDVSGLRESLRALAQPKSEPNYHIKRMVDPQTKTPGGFKAHSWGDSQSSSGPAIDKMGNCFASGNHLLLPLHLGVDRGFGVQRKPSNAQAQLRWKSIPPPPLWEPTVSYACQRIQVPQKQQQQYQAKYNPNLSKPSSVLRRQQQLRVGTITNDQLFLPLDLPCHSTSDSTSGVPVITTLRPKRVQHISHNKRSTITDTYLLSRDNSQQQAIKNSPLLVALSSAKEKEMIGRRLYHRIHATEPERAGRITGILLDSDSSYELLNLLESPAETLKARIHTVLEVLREHQSPDF